MQLERLDLQWAQKSPLLHLSLSPCTGYQLQLASSSRHWCLHIEQPQAQHPLTSTHYYEFTPPPEVWDLLVSDASWYHHREAQNHSPEHSLSPFLTGGMIFPSPSGLLDPCQSSSNNWKLISFNTIWLHPKFKKNIKKTLHLSLYLYLLPLLACTYLNNARKLGVTSTSSVCLPLQDESHYVFPYCRSLWIKASAKWLNVNVNVIYWTGQNLSRQPRETTYIVHNFCSMFNTECCYDQQQTWKEQNILTQRSWGVQKERRRETDRQWERWKQRRGAAWYWIVMNITLGQVFVITVSFSNRLKINNL